MNIVVVGIVCRKRATGEIEYLLVRSRKDFGQYTGYYGPPGGHQEPGERAEETLRRECREELQVDVRPLEELAVSGADVPNQTTYWWSCELLGDVLTPAPEEIADVGFFTRKEMETMNIWPATREFFQQHLH